MAKARAEKGRPQGEPPEKAKAPSAKGSQGPLAEAQVRLARGDVRGARALLRKLAGEAGPAQEEARALLGRIGVDRGALLAAAGVALVILFALWSGLLSRR